MPASCPYCHGPLTCDPATQASPAHCPHCANALPTVPEAAVDTEALGGRPSLVTFLKQDQPPAEPGSPEPNPNDTAGAAAEEAVTAEEDDTSPASDIPQAEATTPGKVEAIETSAHAEPPATEDDVQNEKADAPVPPASATPDTHTIEDVAAHQPAPRAPTTATSPSFTRATASPSSRTTRWVWLALVFLALTLALQIILADRHRLATDPGWRPVILTLCGVFGCSMPDWHEPKAFTMLDRNVRPAANTPGVLDVTATFRNDARWKQAWPSLLLTLSDADGRAVGARLITPGDYLADPTESTGLVPGQSARVAIRVQEPDAGAVSFTFEFH